MNHLGDQLILRMKVGFGSSVPKNIFEGSDNVIMGYCTALKTLQNIIC